MPRDKRLWQDSTAVTPIFDGDPNECSRWVGFAMTKLKFMLSVRTGPSSETLTPVDGVEIHIDARPNKIRIKVVGNIYPTVANNMGRSAEDMPSASPPYQYPTGRYVFYATNNKSERSNFYAGGQSNVITDTKPYSNIVGGDWKGKNKALSWTFKKFGSGPSTNYVLTVFIGGKYSDISFGTVNPNVITLCYVDNSAAIKTAFPASAGYKRVLLLLMYSGSNKVLNMYGASYTSGSQFTASHIDTIDYGTGLTGSLSAFSEDAKRVAAWSVTGGTQSIYVHTFSDDYASFTTATVHSGTLQAITTSGTTNYYDAGTDGAPEPGMHGWIEQSGASSSSLSSGEGRIVHIKPDGDNFCALLEKTLSYTYAYSFSGGVDFLTEPYTVDGSGSASYRMEVIAITTSGVSTEIVSGSFSTSSTSYDYHSDGSIGNEDNIYSTRVLFYSAKDRVLLYDVYYEYHKIDAIAGGPTIGGPPYDFFNTYTRSSYYQQNSTTALINTETNTNNGTNEYGMTHLYHDNHIVFDYVDPSGPVYSTSYGGTSNGEFLAGCAAANDKMILWCTGPAGDVFDGLYGTSDSYTITISLLPINKYAYFTEIPAINANPNEWYAKYASPVTITKLNW